MPDVTTSNTSTPPPTIFLRFTIRKSTLRKRKIYDSGGENQKRANFTQNLRSKFYDFPFTPTNCTKNSLMNFIRILLYFQQISKNRKFWNFGDFIVNIVKFALDFLYSESRGAEGAAARKMDRKIYVTKTVKKHLT